ncbi:MULTISPECIES: hypothetical protein [Cysteiniphilum]|uniref:hypothetical protein n=1 Tax=Cysteiniphilum TaxID=2056696 RepID=UPI00177D528A|nr:MULTISPECIES: hypothetical protein [Cysteiniphilum]
MKSALKIPLLIVAIGAASSAFSASTNLIVNATIGNPQPPAVSIRYFVGNNLAGGTVAFNLGGKSSTGATDTYWGGISTLQDAPTKFSDFSQLNAMGAVEIYDSGDTGLIQFSSIKLSANDDAELVGKTHTSQKISAKVYGAANTVDQSEITFDPKGLGNALPPSYYQNLEAEGVVPLSGSPTYSISSANQSKAIILPVAILGEATNTDVGSWSMDSFKGQLTITVTPTFTNVL